MAPDRPALIGRYRIDRVLGLSALGILYAAHDRTDDRPVALKLLRADLLPEDDRAGIAARFHQEAEAACRCRHPNIVPLIEIAAEAGNPYAVMELVADGDSLADTIGRGRIPAPEAVALATPLLEALACAHDLGIVHRALKPTKILRRLDGTVAVTGFGIARPPSGAVTQAGAMIDTPGHLSPEQCRGEAVDARSNLFSVGTLLYEMLAGVKPFAGRGMSHVMARLLGEDPEDLATLVPGLPPALAAIVHRALAKSPDRRFPSAREMAAALRAAVPHAHAAPLGAGVTAHSGIDPREVGRITDDLAAHLGPLARILVRRTLHDAVSPEDLRRRLAINLGSEADRAAFVGEPEAS